MSKGSLAWRHMLLLFLAFHLAIYSTGASDVPIRSKAGLEGDYADIPIFVTSDSLFHLYHIQFDELLIGSEDQMFYDDRAGLFGGMIE